MVDVVTIGDCVLYHGDALQVLPTLAPGSVDAVVTDPPYGLSERMSGGTWGSADKYGDMRKWDEVAPQAAIEEIVSFCPAAAIWGGNHFSLPPGRGWLVWDKRNAVPTMADVELCWTSCDKPAKRLSLPVGQHRCGHPTEKPLPLMLWTVEYVGGNTVADFFMGSGTTGVACVRLGRKFIGVEIERKYFDIACRRIAKAYEDRANPLFGEEAPKPVQQTLELGT